MAQPPRSSSRPSLQVVAGRYQLIRKIGSGGMGAVYLAKQIGVGNQVALKFLPAHLSDDPMLRKRFEREAALTLEVSHPGAAQLLDSGADEQGHMFLAFEYVAGDDLSGLLDREGALAFSDAVEIISKVAETLSFAHAKGVVHRDIKPENIRVRRDLTGWHVKVLDFGIARVMDEVGTKLTMEGGVTGTPRYMAPEQIGAGTVDARTDVYALGLVLFESLTGREAFDRENTSQLLWAQVNDPVPSLVEVQPLRDSPALDHLISRACAKRQQDRIQSMQDLVAQLKEVPIPQGWGAAIPIKRRAKATFSNEESDVRDPVHLPRPGRKTFLQIRASAWAAMVAGTLALGIAGTALWVALEQRQAPIGPPSGATVHTPAPMIPVASTPSMQPATADLPVEQANAPKKTEALVSERSARTKPLISAGGEDLVAKTSATPGEMPECPQLGVFDTPMTRMTVVQLELQAKAVRYLTPSAIAQELVALKTKAYQFHPDSRECLYRSMLIRMVQKESVVLQSSPMLWGHTRAVADIERLFLEQPLRQDWSIAQRKDLLRQVEALYITPQIKNAPADEVYWRRQYLGLLFVCEATGETLDKAGAKRVPESTCPRLQPAV